MAKILVVSNVLVPPIIAGSCRCIDSYISLLKELGHEVYFLYSGRENEHRIKVAREYWGHFFLYYRYSQFLRLLNWGKRHLSQWILHKYIIDYYYPVYGLSLFIKKVNKEVNFDTIIVNYIWMSRLLLNVDIKNKYLFTHDSFTNKEERINQKMYTLTPSQEAIGLKRADSILSIQENESILFRFLVPHLPVYTIYMPIPFKTSTIRNNKNILFFSGNSDINRNGLLYFLNEVFPSVIGEEQNCQLIVGGDICSFLSVKNSNVHLLGRIDDLDAFYGLADVVINPVYQGTGLKIKTLEALSYGKITIAHSHSIEGLFKGEYAPVLVAHTPNEYARLILDAIHGKINKVKYATLCQQYIDDMNYYIRKQYNLIKLD